MKNAQQALTDKRLDKLMRFEEYGILSRRDWLKLMAVKNGTVNVGKKPMIQYNRLKYNRFGDWKEQQEYERKCNTMIECYELHLPGQSSFWEITKTEYDYFNNMQLAEDINTEKHDLQNRVEAGIATQEEIEKDMQQDIDFMNKYYN